MDAESLAPLAARRGDYASASVGGRFIFVEGHFDHHDKGAGAGEEVTTTQSAKLQAFVLLNIGAMFFGTNHVLLKRVSDQGTSAAVQLFLRFGIAAVALLPWALELAKDTAARRAAGYLGGIMFAAYLAQIVGIGFTSSVHSAVISTFCMLAVPVLAGMEGQRVPFFVWPGTVVAFVGVLALTHSEHPKVPGNEDDELYGAAQSLGLDSFQSVLLGDALCLAAAVLLGYHTLRSADVAAKFGNREIQITALQMCVVAGLGACWLLLDVLLLHRPGQASLGDWMAALPGEVAALPWLPLAFMGLGSTALVLYMELVALQSLSPSVASIVYSGEPVWGVFFAVLFMGDELNALGWVGAVLVVVSGVATQVWEIRGSKLLHRSSKPTPLPM